MKRIFALGLSTVLVLPIISTAVVLAEASTNGSTTTSTQVNKTTPPKTETNKIVAVTATDQTTTATDTTSLQARLEQRKAELKIKLSNIEKLTIQTKCKAAQGLVSSVKGRVKGIETSRSEAYANIVSQLTGLSTKLKNKSADTTTLDADITALQAKIATFNADFGIYKQVVSDLSDMDCKTDPDGFKATLQAARTSLETVTKDSQAVRSYVTDTIKPELAKIRASLGKDATGGSQ